MPGTTTSRNKINTLSFWRTILVLWQPLISIVLNFYEDRSATEFLSNQFIDLVPDIPMLLKKWIWIIKNNWSSFVFYIRFEISWIIGIILSYLPSYDIINCLVAVASPFAWFAQRWPIKTSSSWSKVSVVL